MQISLIAAMTPSKVIGIQDTVSLKNTLPWHIPEELKYFREKTLGKSILMGRKTFESIGKPLPKRLNIILTNNLHFQLSEKYEHCIVAHSIQQALNLEKLKGYQELMVVGGADIYEQFLPIVSRLYLTTIHQEYKGNIYFPTFNLNDWIMVEENIKAHFTTRIYQKKESHN